MPRAWRILIIQLLGRNGMAAGSPGAFSALGEEKIGRLLGMLREEMAAEPPYSALMGDLRGQGLTPEQSRELLVRLYDLHLGTLDPDRTAGMLERMDADGEERRLMAGAFEAIMAARGTRGAPSGAHRGGRATGAAEDPYVNSVNEDAYDEFVRLRKGDPGLDGKFVAFVHGKFQGLGTERMPLVMDMYKRFGNVKMYVGRADGVMPTVVIDSPEVVTD